MKKSGLSVLGLYKVNKLKLIEVVFIVAHKNLPSSSFDVAVISYLKLLLFGVLRHFQHSTGHITTGSWKGRGNQYIQFVRVLYCKLLTKGKQLPAFPLGAVPGTEPQASEVGGESGTTLPPWPHSKLLLNSIATPVAFVLSHV